MLFGKTKPPPPYHKEQTSKELETILAKGVDDYDVVVALETRGIVKQKRDISRVNER